MANYDSATRTNYFRVKDLEEFKEKMACFGIGGGGKEYDLYDTGDICPHDSKDGRVALIMRESVRDLPYYRPDEDSGEHGKYYESGRSFSRFLKAIQDCIAPDDACIITEIGREKMRYLIGEAIVITKNGIRELILEGIALETARELLGDQSWMTQSDY